MDGLYHPYSHPLFFYFQILSVLVVNSLCKNIFLILLANSLFSLSGKMDFQIPCCTCAMATLHLVTLKLFKRKRIAQETNWLTHGRHSPRPHCRDDSGWLGLPRVWCTGGRSTPRTSGSVDPLARIPSYMACTLTRHPSAPVLHLLHNRLQHEAGDEHQCTVTVEDRTVKIRTCSNPC